MHYWLLKKSTSASSALKLDTVGSGFKSDSIDTILFWPCVAAFLKWIGLSGRVKSCVICLPIFVAPFRMAVAPSDSGRVASSACLMKYSHVHRSCCRPADKSKVPLMLDTQSCQPGIFWFCGWVGLVGGPPGRKGGGEGMVPLSSSHRLSFKYSIVSSSSPSSVLSVPQQCCGNTWCNSGDTS